MTPTTATSKAVNVLCPSVRWVLSQLTRNGPWLAGGAARKLYVGQPLGGSDLDVWFGSFAQMIDFKLGLIDQGARLIAETENNKSYQLGPVVVQIITGKVYADHHALLDSFDFNLCQFLYNGERFIHTDAAMKDHTTGILTVNKIALPLYSLARVAKYIDQGMVPAPDVLLKLARAAQDELRAKGEGGSHGT